MSGQAKDIHVTAQGGSDPPGPAGMSGEGTGHPRQQSDCPVHPVDDQAGAQRKATGDKDFGGNPEKMFYPFKGKRLARTPPKSRSFSLGDIPKEIRGQAKESNLFAKKGEEINPTKYGSGGTENNQHLPSEEETECIEQTDRNKKRKDISPIKSVDCGGRGNDGNQKEWTQTHVKGKKPRISEQRRDSSPRGKTDVNDKMSPDSLTGEKLQKYLKTLTQNVIRLHDVLREMYKPKTELKETAEELTKVMEKINAPEITGWVQNCIDQKTESLQIKGSPRKEARQEDRLMQLQEEINEDDIKNIVRKKWDDKAYQRTTVIETDNLIDDGEYSDRAFIVNAGKNKQNPTLKKLAQQKPVIQRMLEKGQPAEGKGFYVTDKTKVVCDEPKTMAEERETESRTYMIGVKTAKEDCEQSETEMMVTAMRVLLDMISKVGVNKVSVATTANINIWILRKTIEIIFRKTDINIIMLVGRREQAEMLEREDGVWETQGRKKRNREKIKMIEIRPNISAGSTYANVLRDMKEQLELDELGVGIDRINKTNEGNLRIKLKEKKEGAADKFKEEAIKRLGTKVQGAREITKRMDTLIIRGIDIVTTKQEITGAIINRLKLNERDITVYTLKEGQNGATQVATIGIEKKYAEELIKIQRLKIGWVNCTIRELINPMRCYRCQKYGHLRKDCTGEERSLRGKCLRCWEEGHTLKVCKNDPRCHECDQVGHQNGTMACPKYRKAVAEIRKMREDTKFKRSGKEKLEENMKVRAEEDNALQHKYGERGQQLDKEGGAKQSIHDNQDTTDKHI